MKISQKEEAFRKNRIRRHAWQRVVFGAACVVVFCTVYALILPAITMEEQVFCGLQEHTHGDTCYEQHLICTIEEGIVPHTHSPECWEMQSVLSCNEIVPEGHTHNDECLNAENPDALICGLEEAPNHVHTDTCYTEQQVLICTIEEGVAPHTHGEECFETVLICQQEEHTHSLLCYSDPSADKESSTRWERTLPRTLSGDWAQDIVAIAQSQLGYTASSRNYILSENGTKKGYTRYGEWYGNPYGDWCAMFVSFCSHYTGIPNEAMLHEMSCMRMVNNLIAVGLFHDAQEDYAPQSGDIIFFQWDGDTIPSHVGIVTEVTEAGIATIEGNSGGKVSKGSYNLADSHILGFASMADISALFAPAPTEEPALEVTETPVTSDQPVISPEPTFETNETDPETTSEPTIEAQEPTPVPVLPEISILESADDSSAGLSSAYAEAGDTVYFRASLTGLQPQDAVTLSEDEEKAPAPLRITLPAANGLFDWRLEDTTEPGAVWVLSDGEISLHTGENGLQYLDIQKSETNLIRLTLPTGQVYSAFASGLQGQAETLASYENRTASVSCLLVNETAVCGHIAHIHNEACYGEDGVYICTLSEHEHVALCFMGNQSDFTYADGELSMSVTAYSRAPLPEGTVLTVAPLEDDEACLRYADFAQTLSPEEGAALLLRKVYLSIDGAPLDADSYLLVASVQVNMDVTNSMVEFLSLDGEEEAQTADKGIIVTALNGFADTVSEGESVLAALGEELPVLTVTLQNGELALLASPTANPTYTVQYYAYIPRFDENGGDTSITVFDTKGKNLPKNSSNNSKKTLFLKKTEVQTTQNKGDKTYLYEVATTDQLISMYRENEYRYVKAPNPSYINKLLDNENYILKEIWVLKSGKEASSTNMEDWDIYSADDIHFTNRKNVANSDANIVFLNDGSVLRMVYDVSTADLDTSVTFYDYDITDGKTDSSTERLLTATAGINSKSNYPATSKNGKNTWSGGEGVLAFGNKNTGTGMGQFKLGKVYLNAASGDSDNYGCTFGIADHFDTENGLIVYNENVVAPDLFNESKGVMTGKKTYPGGSLKFTRVGDTYTLSSATSGSHTVTNLQNFFNPSPKSGKVWAIFTNNFWPMDGVKNADPKFGDDDDKHYFKGKDSHDNAVGGDIAGNLNYLPVSDDGTAHNSFFGMHFAVSFELTDDYVGPLEYYFFGDDDMWVFLGSKLVCDIGGVHSSVGEYVDLWDYIDKANWTEEEVAAGKKTYTLTFFYTERGASGSTCYMNFTLPSVTGATISQKTGSLRVEKEVVGEHDPSEEFDFNIKFLKADGTTPILDDYVYTRYSADGEEIGSDLIIHDGGTFTLCAGEYVIIQYLPYGVQYEITEVSKEGYSTSCKVDGVIQDSSTARSAIVRGATNTVTFTNTVKRTQLKLKKLGMAGTESAPLSNVSFTLSDSSGNTVHVADKGNGSYEVPLSADGYIADQAEYYIALASNPDFVVGVSSLTQGTQLTLQSKNGDTGQKKWIVHRQDDGSYSFRLPGTKQWMDLDDGNTENGHKVHLYGNDVTPTNSDNQKWFLQPNSDGTFTLKPRAAVLNGSNAVLDVHSGSMSNGTAMQVYTFNGTDAQKWLLMPVNSAAAAQTVTEVKTNAEGQLTIAHLLPGEYTLTETTPGGYKDIQPIRVQVKSDGQLELVNDLNNGLVTIGEDGILLQVQNVPVDKTLTLTKRVNGSTTVTDFTFKISYKVGEEITEQTVTLQNDGSTTIEGIPHGATVTITEENCNGFTVAYSRQNMLENGTIEELVQTNQSSYTFVITEDVDILATNTVHYSLPQTGGDGTQLFTTAGLMLSAGSLLFGYRRRRREYQKLSKNNKNVHKRCKLRRRRS